MREAVGALAAAAAAAWSLDALLRGEAFAVSNSPSKRPVPVEGPAASGKKILVVGGGIAGMSAASVLQKSGADVEIIEAGPHLGGRLRGNMIGDIPFDAGAQFFSSQSPFMLSLIQDLGLESQLVEIDPRVGLVRDGTVHRLNPKDLASIFSSGLFGYGELRWPGVIEFVRLLAEAPSRSFSDCTRWAPLDDENAESWGRRTLGGAAVKYLADPFLAGTTFQAPRDTSKAVFLWAMASLVAPNKSYTLRKGLGQISERLSGSLRAKLGTEVREVSCVNGRVLIRDARGRRLVADHVVIAVPAPVARRIYNAPTDVERPLLRIPFKSAVAITALMKRGWRRAPSLTGIYTLMIPEAERRYAAAVLFESSIPGRTADGREVLQIFLAHPAAKTLDGRSDERIIAAITPEIERYVPGFARQRQFTKIARFENAMPDLFPGRIRAIARYRERASAGSPRVTLAGDYLGFPGTEGAVESGAWAARRALRACALT